MTNEQICILLLSLSIFALLQMNVWNIGNRQYSMHFESIHLIKRKGIFKLIYYKPKHFHRYSIWEVISFFASYAILIIFCTLFVISFFVNASKYFVMVLFVLSCLSILYMLLEILYNDISNALERKYMKNITNFNDAEKLIPRDKNYKLAKAIYSYSLTLRFNLERLYNNELEKITADDIKKRDELDDKYIKYFKSYKKILILDNKVVYKEEFSIKYEIQCIFDGNKRNIFPDLNSGTYMPHLVINETKTYLRIAFVSSDLTKFDINGKAIIRTLYDYSLYHNLIAGKEFSIREGNKIVGNGKIISRIK